MLSILFTYLAPPLIVDTCTSGSSSSPSSFTHLFFKLDTRSSYIHQALLNSNYSKFYKPFRFFKDREKSKADGDNFHQIGLQWTAPCEAGVLSMKICKPPLNTASEKNPFYLLLSER